MPLKQLVPIGFSNEYLSVSFFQTHWRTSQPSGVSNQRLQRTLSLIFVVYVSSQAAG